MAKPKSTYTENWKERVNASRRLFGGPSRYVGQLTLILVLRALACLALAVVFALYRAPAQNHSRVGWLALGLFVLFAYTVVLAFVRINDKARFKRWSELQVVVDVVLFAMLYMLTADPNGGIIFLCVLPFFIACEFFEFPGVLATGVFIAAAYLLSLLGMKFWVNGGPSDLDVVRAYLPRLALFSVIAVSYLFTNRLIPLERAFNWWVNEHLGRYDLLLSDQQSAILHVVWSALRLPRAQAVAQIMQAIGHALGCDIGTLRMYRENDQHQAHLVLSASYGVSDEWQDAIRFMPLTDGVSFLIKCFRSGGPPVMTITDVQHSRVGSMHFVDFMKRHGLGSAVAMRLDGHDGKPVGVAAFYRSRVLAFTPEEQEYCKVVAGLLALVTEYFDVVEQERVYASEREASVHALAELSARLTDAASQQALLDLAAQITKEHLSVDVATVFLKEGDVLRRVAMCGLEEDFLRGEAYAVGQGMIGKAFELNEMLLTNTLQYDRSLRHDTFERYHERLTNGAKHQLTAPMRGQQKPIGVLRVLNKIKPDGSLHPDGFTAEDKRLLEIICWVIGIAIEDRRQIDEARGQAARMRTYLTDMTSALVDSANQDALCSVAVHFSASLLQAEDCSLYWVNQASNTLEMVASSGLPNSLLGIYPMPIDAGPKAGLTAYVAATGETLRFSGDTFQQHPAWRGDFTDHLQYLPSRKCTSLLITPIKNEYGTVAGVLKVENKTGHADGFTDLDVELVNTHARQIGISLKQFRRIEEVRNAATRAERGRMAGELHDALNVFHAGVMLEAESVRDLLEHDEVDRAGQGLDRLIRASRFSYNELDFILQDLRDPVLVNDGLEAAIDHYISFLVRDAWHHMRLRLDLRQRLNPDVEHALFRIAQGAISNAMKHAALDPERGGRLSVELLQEDGAVMLRVSDNGRGFIPPKGDEWPFGLRRMKELAGEIGAELNIASRPREGTTVTVTIATARAGAE